MIWTNYRSLKLLLVTLTAIVIVPTSSNGGVVYESWVSTEIKVAKLKQIWTIKNFSFSDLKTGEKLTSPTFTSAINDTCKWRLELYPNGLTTGSEKFVSLFIKPLSCNATADFKLSILNAKQKEIKVLSNSHHFVKDGGWGYLKYIEKDYLFDEKNAVLLHDTLTVICELNVTLGTENTSEELLRTNLQLADMENYLVKDLRFLFENQTFSDVILSAAGQEFRALKAILSARSPIFKAMFENTDEGAKVTRIEITDTEPHILNEMLRYIYTEECPNLKHLAGDLLAAAEKYELVGLKLMCEYSLSAHLTVENAAEYLILADTYSAEELKKQTRHFIVAHASQVANTSALASMIQTHPRLAGEIFQALSCLSTSCIEIQ